MAAAAAAAPQLSISAPSSVWQGARARTLARAVEQVNLAWLEGRELELDSYAGAAAAAAGAYLSNSDKSFTIIQLCEPRK